MPSAKMVSLLRLPPLNKSTRPSGPPRSCSKMRLSARGIDSRSGNVRAQPINRQQGQRKEHTLSQVRDAKYVGQLLKHLLISSNYPATNYLAFNFSACLGASTVSFPPMISALPPALVILSLADWKTCGHAQ